MIDPTEMIYGLLKCLGENRKNVSHIEINTGYIAVTSHQWDLGRYCGEKTQIYPWSPKE
jgi:hypothetical protein